MNKVDLKVVLLGQEYVGKTCLCERFIHQRYKGDNTYQTTIGAVFVSKQMVSNKKKIMLGLWDTAGSERYLAMSRIYYRGSSAAIICYDICNKASWLKTKFWVSELKKHEEGCSIYLCATKQDLIEEGVAVKEISNEEVQQYSEEIKAKHFETSSKTGKNIEKLFQTIVDDYVSNTAKMKAQNRSVLTLEENATKQKCC